MSVRLEEIIPWGRSFDEYRLMFQLNDADLAGSILGCGDGPASFNAEMYAMGRRVISCDPIYAFAAGEIRARFDACAAGLIAQVKARPENYVWSYHRDADALLTSRRAAMDAFLADYDLGKLQGRYLAASLPTLAFDDRQFDVALCSHLLFLYSDLLSCDFHMASIDELCRVSREVRIFPLLSLDCQPSPHLHAVCDHAQRAGNSVEIVRVPYQLQKHGDQMLCIRTGASA